MRCIQGSDAHRLVRESVQAKSLGVGERITEILLDEVSFEALAAVLKGNDFARTRPYRGPANPVDFVQLAREEGESIVQTFHASMAQRGGFLDNVLQDICALANTNGGTIYVGVSDDPKELPVGVREPNKAIERLYTAVANRFSPEIDLHIDSLTSKGKPIMRITVQPGQDLPYAIDDDKFYVRDESETNLAVRDEIVRLVERRLEQGERETIPVPLPLPVPGPVTAVSKPDKKEDEKKDGKLDAPRTGVEIVNSEKRQGIFYHTVRDLRNGNLIKNVTRKSARKLWHYAITQVEAGVPKPNEIKWRGKIAVLDQRKKGDNVWYDLAVRDNGDINIYYGVTDSGLNDEMLALIQSQ
jgi:hypothetical protein